MVTDRQDLDGQLFGVFAGRVTYWGRLQNKRIPVELREHLMNRPLVGSSSRLFKSLG